MLEDDSDKLRIPAPDEDDEPERGQGVFVLGATISILLGLAFFLYQYERAYRPSDSPETRQRRHRSPAPSDADNEFERLARSLRDRRNSEGLDGYQWTSRELVAGLRRGPRYLSEAACRFLVSHPDSGEVSRRVRRELLGLVDRRGEHAPWTCLFTTYFSEPASFSEPVRDEIKAIWRKLRVFKGPQRIFSTVVRDFARRKSAPESAEFRRWLRLCALNFETYADGDCRRLLKASPPGAGRDLLSVVETHLRRGGLNPSFDLPILIDGLGVLKNPVTADS